MPVNQKLLVGFSPEERRAICAQVEAAYARHVKACRAHGANDPDSWEHFSEDFIAVLRAEKIEAPPQPDLEQIRHGRRDYRDTYSAPRDASLI